MSPLKSELEAQLAALDQAVRVLLAEREDRADFWPAFAGRADAILDRAGPQYFAWASDQIDVIIARHELGQGEA